MFVHLTGVKMPNFGSKTEIVVPLTKKGEDEISNQWSAVLVQQGEKNIYVSVSEIIPIWSEIFYYYYCEDEEEVHKHLSVSVK